MVTLVDVDDGLNIWEYKKVDPASQRWLLFPEPEPVVGSEEAAVVGSDEVAVVGSFDG